MPPMPPEQSDNARARRTAAVLLVMLVAVLVAYAIVRFDPIILYGLVGGLIGCLIVVGLDRLHAFRRTFDTQPDRPRS